MISKKALYVGGAFAAALTAFVLAIGRSARTSSATPAPDDPGNAPDDSAAYPYSSEGYGPKAESAYAPSSESASWAQGWTSLVQYPGEETHPAMVEEPAAAQAAPAIPPSLPSFSIVYGLFISAQDVQASRSLWDAFGSSNDPALTEAAAPRYLLTRTVRVAMSDERSGEYYRALAVEDPVVPGGGILTWNRGGGFMQFDEARLAAALEVIGQDIRNLSRGAARVRVSVRGSAGAILPTSRLTAAVAGVISRGGFGNVVFEGQTAVALL